MRINETRLTVTFNSREIWDLTLSQIYKLKAYSRRSISAFDDFSEYWNNLLDKHDREVAMILEFHSYTDSKVESKNYLKSEMKKFYKETKKELSRMKELKELEQSIDQELEEGE